MRAILYKRPNGDQEEISISNVYPEDKQWFEDNHITVSLEDIGIDYAVYGDTGLFDDYEEPIELVVTTMGMSCQDTLSVLRKNLERCLKEINNE